MNKNHHHKDLTRLLLAWQQGNEQAKHAFISLVYKRLEQMAQNQLRKFRGNATMSPGSLIHKMYEKLDKADITWEGKKHFYAVATKAMRQIIINHVQHKRTLKKGGHLILTSLEQEDQHQDEFRGEELLNLDEALNKLAEKEARKTQILEMMYFGGFTQQEIADFLNISLPTVKREARKARMWLNKFLNENV